MSSLCSHCNPGCSEEEFRTQLSQSQIIDSIDDWQAMNAKYYNSEHSGEHTTNQAFYRSARARSAQLTHDFFYIYKLQLFPFPCIVGYPEVKIDLGSLKAERPTFETDIMHEYFRTCFSP